MFKAKTSEQILKRGTVFIYKHKKHRNRRFYQYCTGKKKYKKAHILFHVLILKISLASVIRLMRLIFAQAALYWKVKIKMPEWIHLLFLW